MFVVGGQDSKEDDLDDATLAKMLKKGHDNDVPSAVAVDFFDASKTTDNEVKNDADKKDNEKVVI